MDAGDCVKPVLGQYALCDDDDDNDVIGSMSLKKRFIELVC